MRQLSIIIALILSVNLFAQNVEIENEFVLLGMTNNNFIAKKGACKYEVETFKKQDSVKLNIFIKYAIKYFNENSLKSDIELDTTQYGNVRFLSRNLSKKLHSLSIIKPYYLKYDFKLFPKRVKYKSCGKVEKASIRTSDAEKMDSMEKQLSFMKGVFLRNGRFYNDTIEFIFEKNYFHNNNLESNSEIVFKILTQYSDELRNIELIENVYPLRTIITLRLYSKIIDCEKLRKRAVEPIPNAIGPYRPNPIDYLNIKKN